MFSKLFWQDTFERAISTAAQAVLLALGGQQLDKVSGGYLMLLYAAVGGFLITVIKAIATLQLGHGNSASLTIDNVKNKRAKKK